MARASHRERGTCTCTGKGWLSAAPVLTTNDEESHSANPPRPSSETPEQRGSSAQARFAAAREEYCPPRVPLHWYQESVLHVEARAGLAPAAITWAQSEAPRKGGYGYPTFLHGAIGA